VTTQPAGLQPDRAIAELAATANRWRAASVYLAKLRGGAS
jgi:hypothetical protein